jgi:hypothetical protein
VDPTAEAAIRAGDAQRQILAWSGKKTETLYRVTAPADPVLVHGNRLCRAKGPQPVPFMRRAAMRTPPSNAGPRLWTAGDAMVAAWKSDLVGSDIDPLPGVYEPAATARKLQLISFPVAWTGRSCGFWQRFESR